MQIKVVYKCACMNKEASVDVPFRRADEDIHAWFENCVQQAIFLDHRKRSPLCRATATEYVKIPAPESAPFIGAKPQVN